MVTQCPNCGTGFRITEDLLGLAAGRVRCGACLEIFLARDNLEPETAPPDGESAREVPDDGSREDAEQGTAPARSSVAIPMAASDGPRPAGAMPAGRQSPREIWVYWALATGVLVLALQLVWFVGYR